ncbi:putative immunity protein [Nocardia sp. NPDC127579]|uniref:putative immunity protein n=1 Tax=Nocardia sp. NPDC127579 TaxID=3345402 RepID=UPI0036340637
MASNPRPPDFVLTSDELRAVSAFAVACAEQVIGLFEAAHPTDIRPRAALNAARVFADGGRRTKELRVTAVAAHRAARTAEPPAAHAAVAAGDAAASAYLHPLADAEQVGHILRGPAHCVLALRQRAVEPLTYPQAMAAVLNTVSPEVIRVLLRYPRVGHRRREVAAVMGELDACLRERQPWLPERSPQDAAQWSPRQSPHDTTHGSPR